MAEAVRQRRCAIYTRKSTDEGLEKEFNSLDAQREACGAFVLSHAHEGWRALADHYDDGGYSGGSMDRPALKRLLTDVTAGKVDVVVVYKIDRLTRSLADFAKIVETFDDADCSFVSVTQSFNTTSSMGRLTLNVLLSFAQFEREVAAERIRDKIAASKKRGMWMGGPVPLGYEVIERKLVVAEEEAATVREIMHRYLDSDGVPSLVKELKGAGIVSKRRRMRDGSVKGGTYFRRGALAHLLSNRIYLGQVTHKGKSYDGEHDAIVDQELFDAVQEKLSDNRSGKPRAPQKAGVSMLAGRITDQYGRPMTPCHTKNHGKRYRYYASIPRDGSTEQGVRLPAAELEDVITKKLMHYLRSPSDLLAGFGHLDDGANQDIMTRVATFADRLQELPPEGVKQLLGDLDLQATIGSRAIRVDFRLSQSGHPPSPGSAGQRSGFTVPFATSGKAQEPRLRIDPPPGTSTPPNDALLKLIARAFAARDQLLAMTEADVVAMPIRKRRHLERTAKLSYLAPDIVLAILDGKQPTHLSARRLARAAALPLDWASQRRMLLKAA